MKLRKLSEPKIIKRHDDGDLTIKQGGKGLVLTTDGTLFKETHDKRLKRLLRLRKLKS